MDWVAATAARSMASLYFCLLWGDSTPPCTKPVDATVSASDNEVYRLCAALAVGSVMVSNRSRSSWRSAEEFDMDTPAAAKATERATVMANMRPGVVVMKFQMRRKRRTGPEKVESTNCVAVLNTGFEGYVTSSSQWSWEPGSVDSGEGKSSPLSCTSRCASRCPVIV